MDVGNVRLQGPQQVPIQLGVVVDVLAVADLLVIDLKQCVGDLRLAKKLRRNALQPGAVDQRLRAAGYLQVGQQLERHLRHAAGERFPEPQLHLIGRVHRREESAGRILEIIEFGGQV